MDKEEFEKLLQSVKETKKISRGEKRPGGMTWFQPFGINEDIMRIHWRNGVVTEQIFNHKTGGIKKAKLVRTYECDIVYNKKQKIWELKK